MLDRLRFSVVEARILVSSTGKALDTFLLLESDSQAPASLQRAEELRSRMLRALALGKLSYTRWPRGDQHFLAFPIRELEQVGAVILKLKREAA